MSLRNLGQASKQCGCLLPLPPPISELAYALLPVSLPILVFVLLLLYPSSSSLFLYD